MAAGLPSAPAGGFHHAAASAADDGVAALRQLAADGFGCGQRLRRRAIAPNNSDDHGEAMIRSTGRGNKQLRPGGLLLPVGYGVNRRKVESAHVAEPVLAKQIDERLGGHELIADERFEELDAAHDPRRYRPASFRRVREGEVGDHELAVRLQGAMDVAGHLLNIAALMHGDVDEHDIELVRRIHLLQGALHERHPLFESSLLKLFRHQF